LQTVPLSTHIVKTFESLLPSISSKKGKAMMEKIRPVILSVAKNMEMITTTGDIVLGVVGLGLGTKDVVRAVTHHKKMKPFSANSDVFNRTGEYAWKGFVNGVFGSVMIAGRPITRLADVGGLPLAKKIALWTDGILLRKEQQRKQ